MEVGLEGSGGIPVLWVGRLGPGSDLRPLAAR